MQTLHNGEPVKWSVITKKLVREPRPRRVLVGRAAYSVPGADGLNWGALANCESGGNPHAVNPAGYYGLYQFDTGTWRSVGGSGLPTSASAAEQTYRAKLLYQQRGRSPWPTCGRLL
ncbi:transglycosylase family protein [Nocardioides sp. G10]|uniref:Transglycosylase family protein n=1 Tax=Nocardioides baculatus TaxID=2801337 RepID=A0ABS1L7N3_9ACTN|nr:transglycosylase family protein [Nocardioides baculatus]